MSESEIDTKKFYQLLTRHNILQGVKICSTRDKYGTVSETEEEIRLIWLKYVQGLLTEKIMQLYISIEKNQTQKSGQHEAGKILSTP